MTEPGPLELQFSDNTHTETHTHGPVSGRAFCRPSVSVYECVFVYLGHEGVTKI